MYVKPNNAGKELKLRAQTATQNMKKSAQTQDGKQGLSVLYMTN